MRVRRTLALGIAALGALAYPASASAEVIIGVSETAPQELIAFDSAAPGTLVNRPNSVSNAPVPISGLGAGETIVGIDYRPANGGLYAVSKDAGTDGRLYRINEVNGQASAVGAATFALGAGTSYGVDFNPVVDRLRIVSNIPSPDPNADPPAQVGNNFRVSPDNGALVALDTSLGYPPGDPQDAVNPGAVALAYSSNRAGSSSTTAHVYDRQGATHFYARLGGVNGTPSPNGGALTRPGGTVFVAFDESIGLDVSAAGGGFIAASGGANSLFFTMADPVTGAAGGGGLIGPGGTKYPHISAVPSGLLSPRDITVSEGAGPVTISLDREHGTVGPVAVDAGQAPGSASAGADYTPAPGTFSFANGQDKVTFQVPIIQDPNDEPDETFTVNLVNAINGAVIEDAAATVTIEDDDPTPSPLVVRDVRVQEGEAASVEVSRTGGGQEAVSVDFATSPGSAGSEDFSATSGTLDIPAGDNSATFQVPTTEDTFDEDDEAFAVQLTNPTGPASISDGAAEVVITEDPPREGACVNEQVGTVGPDTIVGTDEGDTLTGLSGADKLIGEGDQDCLDGGTGRDDIAGGASGDRLVGGPGRDSLSGSSGDDRINSRDEHEDRVRCGKGEDRVKTDERDQVAGNCETVRL